ncbi:MAG: Clp protease ClpP [Lactobacillus sp.]|jgi:ATP-dependent protease ClpP protease subunit|nr:Clp protease ClpP [Lactobacillus sp.]MCI2032067.1 Clp protease ClpP [Lactobacillus sp.]
MINIDIKGDVVDDGSGAFYDWLGMPCAHPSAISTALAVDDGDDVTVDVASGGGDVFAASEIYTMLKNHAGTVTINIQGLAASAASVIAMAGDKITMSPTAMMMIHRASTVVAGNSDDLNASVDMLDTADQAIASAYEAKTGMAQGKLLDLMAKETWMTAKDAVSNGFADEVMVFDDSQPQVTNATGTAIPKAGLNKLATLLIKADELPKAKAPTPEPKMAPQPIENNKPMPTLRDAKLAILMGKTQKEG